MADWKTIPDTDVDPDAPVTSELMYALRDNPVALAEGAIGAPRIHPSAYQTKIFETSLGFNIPVTVTDLDTSMLLQIHFFLARSDSGGSGSLVQIEYRASNDNGSTFGAWRTSPLNTPLLNAVANGNTNTTSPIIRLSDGIAFSRIPSGSIAGPDVFTDLYPTNALSFRVTGTSSSFTGAYLIVLGVGRG